MLCPECGKRHGLRITKKVTEEGMSQEWINNHQFTNADRKPCFHCWNIDYELKLHSGIIK